METLVGRATDSAFFGGGAFGGFRRLGEGGSGGEERRGKGEEGKSGAVHGDSPGLGDLRFGLLAGCAPAD